MSNWNQFINFMHEIDINNNVSRNAIANKLGLFPETIGVYLNKLKRAGLIEVIRKIEGNSNIYKIICPIPLGISMKDTLKMAYEDEERQKKINPLTDLSNIPDIDKEEVQAKKPNNMWGKVMNYLSNYNVFNNVMTEDISKNTGIKHEIVNIYMNSLEKNKFVNYIDGGGLYRKYCISTKIPKDLKSTNIVIPKESNEQIHENYKQNIVKNDQENISKEYISLSNQNSEEKTNLIPDYTEIKIKAYIKKGITYSHILEIFDNTEVFEGFDELNIKIKNSGDRISK